ncbi:protein of unknown function [Methylocella tundrae]|uniref:Uncharacterized protein n=1 Tax=Methylocella tundrae TaxID=227605 RepID=A0A4U8Z0H4_METTU|nr:protein of unknown function [Methylocella tundrae]
MSHPVPAMWRVWRVQGGFQKTIPNVLFNHFNVLKYH